MRRGGERTTVQAMRDRGPRSEFAHMGYHEQLLDLLLNHFRSVFSRKATGENVPRSELPCPHLTFPGGSH